MILASMSAMAFIRQTNRNPKDAEDEKTQLIGYDVTISQPLHDVPNLGVRRPREAAEPLLIGGIIVRAYIGIGPRRPPWGNPPTAESRDIQIATGIQILHQSMSYSWCLKSPGLAF